MGCRGQIVFAERLCWKNHGVNTLGNAVCGTCDSAKLQGSRHLKVSHIIQSVCRSIFRKKKPCKFTAIAGVASCC